jgi:uncharacterized protein involved in exopolysaccharide biosynthesis
MNVMATDGTVPAWGHVAALGRQLRERRHRARAFGRVLWRHKLLILACLGIVLGLTAAYVSTLAPAYEAEALVAVARPDRPDGQGVATQDGTAEDQLRLIEFRALAERLAERLNLQLLPEFRPEHAPRDVREVGGWLPHALIDRLPQAWADPLTGRPARALTDAQRAARLWDAVIAATMARTRAEVTGSSAIGFKFVSEDPQLAAAGANALAELYLEQRPALQRNAPQSDRDELAQEIARLRAAIRDTEQAIAAARPGADAQASGSEESRLDLAGELAFWRRERAELEARLHQSQAALEADAPLAQTPGSEPLNHLQARALELRETLTAVSQQSGEQAPEVAELRAQLAAVEQERRAELEGTLKRLQDEMAIIQSRETALEEKIKALGEEDAAGERPDGLSALKQKLEADRALLRDRLDQAARLEARPAAPQGAARAITPAAVPIRPAYPRLALIWGAAASGALILGVVLALALEAFPGGRA